jgi:uncharacterized protein
MSALPETVDAWRMVAAGRRFEGSVRVRDMPRLRESLTRDDATIRYEIEFGRDELGVAFLALKAAGHLPLECQRTLDEFELELAVDQRLGLIAREEDEAALPPGYEPLLTESGEVSLADVIEDELILALPVVPIRPGSESESGAVWEATPPEGAGGPFAELSRLKKR